MPFPYTPLSLVSVGQKIKASIANAWINAIDDLQAWADATDDDLDAAQAAIALLDSTDTWTIGTSSGTGWTADYAYRIVARRGIDVRLRVFYASPPSTLSLTQVDAIPALAAADAPPGFPLNASGVPVFARADPSTNRVVMPGFISGRDSLVRGGSSNPSGYDIFEFCTFYSGDI